MSSPWANETPLRDGRTGTVFYAPRAPVVLPPASDDTFYTWREGDRLPTLAASAWGDPTLWWVLCDVNAIADPFAIAAGTVLRLPSRARVAMEVWG